MCGDKFGQLVMLSTSCTASLGKRELFGNQLGLAGKLLVEHRQAFLNLGLLVGHRSGIPSFLGQKAFGKNDCSGVSGNANRTASCAYRHVHGRAHRLEPRAGVARVAYRIIENCGQLEQDEPVLLQRRHTAI